MASVYEGHLAAYGISVPVACPTEDLIAKEIAYRRSKGQPETVIKTAEILSKNAKVQVRHVCHPILYPDDAKVDDVVGTVKDDIYVDDEGKTATSVPFWKRNSYFEDTCIALCIDAAQKALKNWGKEKEGITHVLTTCTSGWREPGIACSVIEALELSEDTQKCELNYNGCFCGATCLRLARDIIRAGDGNAVLVVACEVASHNINWDSTDMDQLISHSLFADGAAAIIVAREGIWRFSQSGMSIVPNSKELLGLRPPSAEGETAYTMTLSKNVSPSLNKYFAEGHGKKLLKGMYNPKEPRPALAIHPGGPRILEAVGDVLQSLGWKEKALDASFDTFKHFGNLGSAMLLFVLAERMRQNDIKEDKLIAMAFGPGVTVEWATYERSTIPRTGITNAPVTTTPATSEVMAVEDFKSSPSTSVFNPTVVMVIALAILANMLTVLFMKGQAQSA